MVRTIVSGETSASKEPFLFDTTVRHTPSTAMLSPRRNAFRARREMLTRAPALFCLMAETVPRSVMIPVNMSVGIGHDHQIFTQSLHRVESKTERLVEMTHSVVLEHGRCVASADNHRSDEHDHLLP